MSKNKDLLDQVTIDKIVEHHLKGVGLGEIARMYKCSIDKVEDVLLEALQQKMTSRGDLLDKLKLLHIARMEALVSRIMPTLLNNQEVVPGKQAFAQLVGVLLDISSFQQDIAKGDVKSVDKLQDEGYDELLAKCQQIGIPVGE